MPFSLAKPLCHVLQIAGLFQNKLFINSGKVLCQLAQLFLNRLADLLCRFLTAETELQEIPVCLCSIGAGLAAVGRIMQFVQ